MLGLQRGTIRIIRADPAWAIAFAEERQHLHEAIGQLVLDIQHVGSTSVPGLDAKPIIDIAIAVASRRDIAPCRPSLLALGYQDCGDGGSDGGYLFVKESRPEVRTHHLHIVTLDDPQWANYLQFRDRLRADDALRDEYASLKHLLKEHYADNRRAYTAAKRPFIRRILGRVCNLIYAPPRPFAVRVSARFWPVRAPGTGRIWNVRGSAEGFANTP